MKFSTKMEISNENTLEVCLDKVTTPQQSTCDDHEKKTSTDRLLDVYTTRTREHAQVKSGTEQLTKGKEPSSVHVQTEIEEDKAKNTQEKEEKPTTTDEIRKEDKAIDTEDFKTTDKTIHLMDTSTLMCRSDEKLGNIEKLLVQLKRATEEKDIQLDLIHRDLKKCLHTLEDLSREMRVKRRYEEDSDDSIDE